MSEYKPHILYVDDEPNNTTVFKYSFEEFDITTCNVPTEALQLLSDNKFGVLVTDQRMPGLDGLTLAKQAHKLNPEIVIIMVTAYTDQALLLDALNSSTLWRFVRKPWTEEDMRALLAQAVQIAEDRWVAGQARLRSEQTLVHIAEAQARAAGEDEFWAFAAPAMCALIEQLDRAAATEATILLRGETGTGKEYLARRMHRISQRNQAPFVAVNCASLPDDLVESELFGHCKGAFTGASKNRLGRFQLADGGTLFLDEVADLSAHAQASLLRAIQEKTITPVGADSDIQVDFRLVAASHKDLQQEVSAGRFREDLYWRLAQLPLEVPPLRDRPDDILPLLKYFAGRLEKDTGTSYAQALNDAALKRIVAQYREHAWPGNLREIEVVLHRHMLTGDTAAPPAARQESTATTKDETSRDMAMNLDGTLDQRLEKFERQQIESILEATGYQLAATARQLGIKRPTLYYRMDKLRIPRDNPSVI